MSFAVFPLAKLQVFQIAPVFALMSIFCSKICSRIAHCTSHSFLLLKRRKLKETVEGYLKISPQSHQFPTSPEAAGSESCCPRLPWCYYICTNPQMTVYYLTSLCAFWHNDKCLHPKHPSEASCSLLTFHFESMLIRKKEVFVFMSGLLQIRK